MNIVQLASGLAVVNAYAAVFLCNAAIFLYEFLITLSDEVKLIWPSGCGPATILYYASRYTVIPEICVQMIFLFGYLSTPQFSMGIGVILGQGIIVLRTWAIWDGSRTLIWCLSSVSVIVVGNHLYLSAEYISKTEVVASSTKLPHARGCSVVTSHNRLYVGWVLLCAYDIVLICLTIFKYLQERAAKARLGGASLGRTAPNLTASLYRDAFTYFTLILAFALANLTVTLLVPVQYRMLLYGTERIIYTCLACRIIINLRAAAQKPISVSTIDPAATNLAQRDEEQHGTREIA